MKYKAFEVKTPVFHPNIIQSESETDALALAQNKSKLIKDKSPY